MRSKNRAVPLLKIQEKALEEAGKSGESTFKASSQWAQQFLKRHGLSMRRVTSVGQPLPPDAEQQITEFRNRFTKASRDITDDNIGIMDEVPVPFDIVYGRTVHPKGSDSVRIDTTGHSKKNLTVVLAVMASGEKLSPMLIFKKKLVPKVNFPEGVVVKANQKGWMNESIMTEWIEGVWRTRRGFLSDPAKSLLVLDAARAHLTERVTRTLGNNSRIEVIPGGLTKFCQPLDVSVNKCFKENLRKLWEEWMADEDRAEYIKSGRRKAMGYDVMANIVKQASEEVSVETIRNGFRKALNIPMQDETSDDSETESNCEENESVCGTSESEDGADETEDSASESEDDIQFSITDEIRAKFDDISFA